MTASDDCLSGSGATSAAECPQRRCVTRRTSDSQALVEGMRFAGPPGVRPAIRHSPQTDRVRAACVRASTSSGTCGITAPINRPHTMLAWPRTCHADRWRRKPNTAGEAQQ